MQAPSSSNEVVKGFLIYVVSDGRCGTIKLDLFGSSSDGFLCS